MGPCIVSATENEVVFCMLLALASFVTSSAMGADQACSAIIVSVAESHTTSILWNAVVWVAFLYSEEDLSKYALSVWVPFWLHDSKW